MIIALANYKSSSGKSTIALNLGSALVEMGHSVRLWDLDAQRDLATMGPLVGLQSTATEAMSLRAHIEASPADFHLIECPPRKEFESEILTALSCCDALIVPVECEYMMLRGMGNFNSTRQIAMQRNPSLKWRAVVTKFKTRQKKHLSGLQNSGVPLFQTIIRDSEWVADAPAHDKTVLQYAPRSGPARAFRGFAKEVVLWQKQ
jgi:chromosome partitioning protein